jgi:hypothetical protein
MSERTDRDETVEPARPAEGHESMPKAGNA